MKHAYLIALMIIIAVAVDKIEDQISDDDFKQTMEKFMNRGSRNTSSMGEALCYRTEYLEIHEFGKSRSMQSCKDIYQPAAKQVK